MVTNTEHSARSTMIGKQMTADYNEAENSIVDRPTTKRLSLDVPAELHTRFKTSCSATGRKMANELMRFVLERTEELENEAAERRKSRR